MSAIQVTIQMLHMKKDTRHNNKLIPLVSRKLASVAQKHISSFGLQYGIFYEYLMSRKTIICFSNVHISVALIYKHSWLPNAIL